MGAKERKGHSHSAPYDAPHCPDCGAKLDASLPRPPQWTNEGENGAGLAARLETYARSLGIEVAKAEATAYVVCAHFGFETNAPNYVTVQK